MLVLLPPSETKAAGGDGPPLHLGALSHPELTAVRERLVDALVRLAADVPASLTALGLSVGQADEVARNAALRDSPTMPALHRYTGVLYDALGLRTFTRSQLARARQRLAVGSALFGLVGGADPIPAYRLSGGSMLPGVGGLRGVWRADLEKTLSTVDDLVVDLRSGPYAALATLPGAVTVRVVSEDDTGRRLAISHNNKAYKGRLAAVLATAPREPSTVAGLVRIATRAGLSLRRTAERELDLVVS